MNKFFIYILELENNKYYVGIAKNVEKRFSKHAKGKGSEWTKIFKPIRIIEKLDLDIYDQDEAEHFEDLITLKKMKKFGWNNVRGGKYSIIESQKLKKILDNSTLFINDKTQEINKTEYISPKYFIYVLLLEAQKIYVGYTINMKNALKKIYKGTNSKWLRKYPPLELLEVKEYENKKKCLDSLNDIVIEMMKIYGIYNVRGGDFTFFNDTRHYLFLEEHYGKSFLAEIPKY